MERADTNTRDTEEDHREGIPAAEETRVEETDTGHHDPYESGRGDDWEARSAGSIPSTLLDHGHQSARGSR
jgi:hypothetical protein